MWFDVRMVHNGSFCRQPVGYSKLVQTSFWTTTVSLKKAEGVCSPPGIFSKHPENGNKASMSREGLKAKEGELSPWLWVKTQVCTPVNTPKA